MSVFVKNNPLKVESVNIDYARDSSLQSILAKLTTSSQNQLYVTDQGTQAILLTMLNTRGFATFNNGGAISANVNSTVISLENVNVRCLTIYGHASAATTLTVFFSNDGVSFYASQYSFVISSAMGGDFGFALNACPKNICIQSSVALTSLFAYLDYS